MSFIFFSTNALTAAGAFIDRGRTPRLSLRFLKTSFFHRMQGSSLRVRERLVYTFREPTFESLSRDYFKVGRLADLLQAGARQPVLQPTSPWLWLLSWSRGNSGLRKFYGSSAQSVGWMSPVGADTVKSDSATSLVADSPWFV